MSGKFDPGHDVPCHLSRGSTMATASFMITYYNSYTVSSSHSSSYLYVVVPILLDG
jgi:hypothetical protein